VKLLDGASIENIIRASLSKCSHLYDRQPIFFQNILTTLRGFFLSQLRYNKVFYQTLQQITTHDHYSPGELQNYQQHKLRQLVSHAYAQTLFYKEIMDNNQLTPDGIHSVENLRRLPVVTREQIRENFDKLLLTKKTKGRIIVYTSGTSGSGLPVAYNKNDLARNWAFMFRQFLWAGVKPGDWRITLFGSRIVPVEQSQPPYWRYNWFERQILLSIFHLSAATSRDYIAFLKKHEGLMLEGFASVLGIIADFILQDKQEIPMKIVYSTGEPMNDHCREKVEQAFQCKVYDCYGMTEWVGLIQECEHGGKHLMSDYGILEIVDENNEPVDPGVEGYFVWTGLQREEMPLLRYKIGDRGMWNLKQECPCGRAYPLVDTTITRDSDIITTPDGAMFSPRVINQYLKNKTSFRNCQFVQESAHELIIRIVPGEGDYESDAYTLQQDLDKIFKQSLALKIIYADFPLMRGQGKYPLIINNV